MKYMTFNSSCSYAGIANMLEQYGVDTTDRHIALEMKLPYLFSYYDGVYLSGPMLQTEEWFNCYLNPIGYELIEEVISANEIGEYLTAQKTAMLGIQMQGNGKHAVVFIRKELDCFVFINNKWEHEEAPSEIRYTEKELKNRIETNAVVATLRQISPKQADVLPKLKHSVAVLEKLLEEILCLCSKEETVSNLHSKLNTLFRPLFLDGITMLKLIDETSLAAEFEFLQKELLQALYQDSSKQIMLSEYLSMAKIKEAVSCYIQLIMHVIDEMAAQQ